MEEVPENGKESSHSARANGMNEWMDIICNIKFFSCVFISVWSFEYQVKAMQTHVCCFLSFRVLFIQ